ncbi:MAG: protein translocase subunit SecF, partial [Hydrotalea flava]|nr:protein translocase subunit SecF [Hydrotalea flava]NIO93591.1 protein translocase subunit SecF [Hydrotalea flava]
MDIIGKRKIWYIISTILILPGIIGLFSWKLNFGIDFAGGTLVEY